MLSLKTPLRKWEQNLWGFHGTWMSMAPGLTSQGTQHTVGRVSILSFLRSSELSQSTRKVLLLAHATGRG